MSKKVKEQEAHIKVGEKFSAIYEPNTPEHPGKRYYLRSGGRASGKTQAFVTAALLRALYVAEKVLCLRRGQKAVSESAHSLVREKVKALGLEQHTTVGESQIGTSAGSRFTFEDALRPLPHWRDATICFIDDAHELTDGDWRELLGALGKNVEVWAAWRSGSEESQPAVFNRFVENLDPSTTDYEHTTYKDNPHLPQVVKDQIEYDKVRNPELYRSVWLGEQS